MAVRVKEDDADTLFDTFAEALLVPDDDEDLLIEVLPVVVREAVVVRDIVVDPVLVRLEVLVKLI